MTIGELNWLGVLLAALSTFMLGGLWYSPLLFGRRWQALVGLSDETLGQGFGKVFGGAFVYALVGSVNMGMFVGKAATVSFGAFAGAATGVGWVATGLVTTGLFERRPGALIAIDAGYHAVSFTVMGVVVAAMS